MGKTIKPIRLTPVYIKSIWAGDRLSKIRNLKEIGIGISREVCAYKGSENTIEDGEFKGKTIDYVIKNYHEELMGKDPSNQLIRAAYIDAVEDLSIQVHPEHSYAKQKGDYEKSESWYILEADKDASITAGTTIEDKVRLRKAAEEGTLENYIKKIPVQQGDFVLIPAQMLHACGKNMLALEIGSFGGITYRLYDYGRPRKLDLEDGFLVLNPTLQTTITHHPLPKQPINHIEKGVEHPLFQVDVIDIKNKMTIKTDGFYQIIVCVHKSGYVIVDGETFELGYTKTLLIPTCTKEFTLKGDFRILRAWHPFTE